MIGNNSWRICLKITWPSLWSRCRGRHSGWSISPSRLSAQMKNYLYSSAIGCPTHSRYYNINQVLPICNCGTTSGPYCLSSGSGSLSRFEPSATTSCPPQCSHGRSLTQIKTSEGWTYEPARCKHRKCWRGWAEEEEWERHRQRSDQRQVQFSPIP